MLALKVIWTIICCIVTYPFLSDSEKRMIIKDVQRWGEVNEKVASKKYFLVLFSESAEFRSVVYFRLRRRFRFLPSIFLKGQDSCFISMSPNEVGTGLYIMHGFSTIINCEAIGDNCTVFQQVTLGYSKGGKPTIGNNCVICCGAVVVGGVHIGDNVLLGAGTVVRTDVPSNSVVIGNPCNIKPKKFEGDILDYI